MKTREILIIGLFIIAVCIISLIPFSNNILENREEQNTFVETFGNTTLTQTPEVTTPMVTTPMVTTPMVTTPEVTTPMVTTPTVTTPTVTTPTVTTKPIITSVVQKFPTKITTNSDIINAIIYVTSKPPDYNNDRMSIYNIQGLISQLNTQNSATLLGEISNPNNLVEPRLFLQYMNWFASHCPLDSDTCTGLC